MVGQQTEAAADDLEEETLEQQGPVSAPAAAYSLGAVHVAAPEPGVEEGEWAAGH